MNPPLQTAPTERDLILQAQAGDEQALGHLLEDNLGFVICIAHHILNNKTDEEEVLAEVWFRVWRNIKQFDPERGEFSTWLGTIANHCARDEARKRRRHIHSSLPEEIEVNPPSPHEEVVLGELLAAIASLDERRRRVLSLSLEGLSYKAIAERMGIPEGTVGRLLTLARERLWSILVDPRQ
jgi:RNA polymerase sigma-70 factor (ECF subfamily)